MDKQTVISLLRGVTCDKCRYLLRRGRDINGFMGMIDLDPPHCAIKTTFDGKPHDKSKISHPEIFSCSKFWKHEVSYY